MAFEQKEGQGALFRNDKGDNPNRPDYKGELMVNGVLLELGAWIKDGAKGKFMSISAKPKQTGRPAQEAPKGSIADMDSDIPF